MESNIQLDASNRIVLTQALREAAGITRRQKLRVSSTPGRIVLEVSADSSGKVVKKGKWKVWTGVVPATPIDDAVDQVRHYSR